MFLFISIYIIILIYNDCHNIQCMTHTRTRAHTHTHTHTHTINCHDFNS